MLRIKESKREEFENWALDNGFIKSNNGIILYEFEDSTNGFYDNDINMQINENSCIKYKNA